MRSCSVTCLRIHVGASVKHQLRLFFFLACAFIMSSVPATLDVAWVTYLSYIANDRNLNNKKNNEDSSVDHEEVEFGRAA